jgi:PIN domain nuclease of toxin-antitoxin system
VVSAWEIQVKLQTGKLQLPLSAEAMVYSQIEANGFELLPIYLQHVARLAHLPPLHRDPFDRMLNRSIPERRRGLIDE